jgi:5S rRNA maturation endonuclease (ribonuclease M5)
MTYDKIINIKCISGIPMKDEQSEKFNAILDKIKKSNILIIVEGKRDRSALEKLGLKNIKELSKKPLFQVVEEAVDETKEVVILTDLDKKGKELYGKLNRDLQGFGVKVNNELRNFLFKKTKLRQIEGLDSYVEKLGIQ